MPWLGVQETIHINPLRVMRQVCQAAITCQDYDEEEEMYPWRRIYSREEEFEERERGIECVFGDVGPELESSREVGI